MRTDEMKLSLDREVNTTGALVEHVKSNGRTELKIHTKGLIRKRYQTITLLRCQHRLL